MMEERTQEELEWYMERFASLIQICLDENQKTLKHPYDTEVVVTKGRKYWKIMVEEDHSRDYPHFKGKLSDQRTRIFGFVRREDGAILRAADMKAPETRTKNPVRGYIWEEDAADTFSWTGINYDMAT